MASARHPESSFKDNRDLSFEGNIFGTIANIFSARRSTYTSLQRRPPHAKNVASKSVYEMGSCSFYHPHEGALDTHVLSGEFNLQLPTTLIEERREQCSSQIQEQAERDRKQFDPRAKWYAKQELSLLVQEDVVVFLRNQELVSDPDHHPESSRFLQKIREDMGLCASCNLYISSSNDFRRLPCGHVLHTVASFTHSNSLVRIDAPVDIRSSSSSDQQTSTAILPV